ncbi:hypothetical protein D3C79_972620 [compost metagenome]
MFGFIEQIRFAAKAAKDEIAVTAVLLAVGANMPAHTGVNQCMRCYQAYLWLGIAQRHVFGFQAQPFATGLEQRAKNLWANRSIWHFQDLGMGVSQLQSFDMFGAFVVLKQ